MDCLTIEEVVFLWTAKFKYDHKLLGHTFEDEEVSREVAHEKLEDLKRTYGDLL